jgi:hypothetical protein
MTLLDFKTYYKSNQDNVVLEKCDIGSLALLESLEIHPHKNGQLILDKGAKA